MPGPTTQLTRFPQSVFGAGASASQIGVFGSLAAGSPRFTTNPGSIQSLSPYNIGWFAAVEDGASPAIEDMNAMHYLYGYQLSYLMQQGVAEWDATTTYFTNNIVASSGALYVSVSDDNLNNDVTDTDFWTPFSSGGGVGAALDLSNLTNPTAIPVDLLFQNDDGNGGPNIGDFAGTTRPANGVFGTLLSVGAYNVFTGTSLGIQGPSVLGGLISSQTSNGGIMAFSIANPNNSFIGGTETTEGQIGFLNTGNGSAVYLGSDDGQAMHLYKNSTDQGVLSTQLASGTGTLSSGSASITFVGTTTTCVVVASITSPSGSPGSLFPAQLNAGSGFVIKSSAGSADNSTFQYRVFK